MGNNLRFLAAQTASKSDGVLRCGDLGKKSPNFVANKQQTLDEISPEFCDKLALNTWVKCLRISCGIRNGHLGGMSFNFVANHQWTLGRNVSKFRGKSAINT